MSPELEPPLAPMEAQRAEHLPEGEGWLYEPKWDGFRSRAGRSTEWESLRPELVAEVVYDHWSGGRFRHGTRLLRFRPDKAPRQCTFDQLARRGRRPG